MRHPSLSTLGEALDACYRDAKGAWKRGYAGDTPIADLLAGPLSSATVEATIFPGGRMTVVTTFRGRRHLEDDVHVFRYNRVSGQGWRRAGSTL